MLLFDILELLDVIEAFLSVLDGFRSWRQSESDARIRQASAKWSRGSGLGE
jgi:hypothetical protein